MKTILIMIGGASLLVTAVFVMAHMPLNESRNEESSAIQHIFEHSRPNSAHAQQAGESTTAEHNKTPVTLGFGQTDDYNLCNDEFWVGVYDFMKDVYIIGIENVSVELLEEKTFDYFSGLPNLSREETDAWIDHIQDIPAQFVEIIREDPAVLHSCANFSVAAVGPP